MLTIRFLRVGKKNQPAFRIVVTEKTNPPRGGRFLEVVGFYNPLTKERNLKQDRIKYWVSVGAKPSNTVHNLLISEKVIEGKKISVHPKKKEEEKKADVKSPVAEVKEQIMEKSEIESPKKEPASAMATAGEEKPKEKTKNQKEVKKEPPAEKPSEEKKLDKEPKVASIEDANLVPAGQEEKVEEPAKEEPKEKPEIVENKKEE